MSFLASMFDDPTPPVRTVSRHTSGVGGLIVAIAVRICMLMLMLSFVAVSVLATIAVGLTPLIWICDVASVGFSLGAVFCCHRLAGDATQLQTTSNTTSTF